MILDDDDDDDDEEDDDEVEDNDNNNLLNPSKMSVQNFSVANFSASGIDRDLGFSRGPPSGIPPRS